MKKLLFILTFLCFGFIAKAQLRFVSADSIMTWDNDVMNLRNTALNVGQQLRPQTLTATPTQLPALESAWQQMKGRDCATENAFSAGNRFNLAAQMLLLTADAHYAREMEQLIYGPLIQNATQSEMGAEKMAAAQTLLNAIGTMMAIKNDTVYVNFYANASVILPHAAGNYQLDLITGMPFHERVKIRFAQMPTRQGLKLTICIRLPEGEWNDTSFPIYCNGHDTPYLIERGYAIITNTWRPGFEIYFDLPQPLLEMR
jgi:DUF1680 family protein